MMIFVYFAHYYLLLSVLVPYAKLYATSTIKTQTQTHIFVLIRMPGHVVLKFSAVVLKYPTCNLCFHILVCKMSIKLKFLQIVTSEKKILTYKWENGQILALNSNFLGSKEAKNLQSFVGNRVYIVIIQCTYVLGIHIWLWFHVGKVN